MKKEKDKSSFEIGLLSKAYINSKRLLLEAEQHVISIGESSFKASSFIVKHIEYCLNSLDIKSRIIIQNEVIEGKTGKWYLEYFSASTYYRLRKKAYEDFLRCL